MEALKEEDGRESEGGALAPDMKEMMDAMRLAYMPPPTFSGGSCGDYWEFRQAFKDHAKATNIPYRMKVNKMFLSAYAGHIMAVLQERIRIKDPKLGYEQAFATLDEEYRDKGIR